MIFQLSVRSCPLSRKTNLTGWRVLRSCLHSSSICALPGTGPGPGCLYSPEELSSVSTEKPHHTPVLLKEVLHNLDVQPGQVCLHVFYLCKPFNVFRKLHSFRVNVGTEYECRGSWAHTLYTPK